MYCTTLSSLKTGKTFRLYEKSTVLYKLVYKYPDGEHGVIVAVNTVDPMLPSFVDLMMSVYVSNL